MALNERLHGTKLLIVDADPFGISLNRCYLERAGPGGDAGARRGVGAGRLRG
ncbi:MAG: hypothetical protein R3F59_06385 [Myxococcota bacterium]